MGHRHDEGHERHGHDDGHDRTETNNEISGGHFSGSVGQFGHVHGDVHLSPPRSPEEAAFRARYMARMQEAWDAEERLKAAQKAAAERDHVEWSAMGYGCLALFVALFVLAMLVAMFAT